MKTKNLLLLGAVLCSLFLTVNSSFAQGTAFTYQGRLTDGANPVTGIYELRFTISDASSGGSVVGGPLTNSPTGITNGLFTVRLDFGSGVFTGAGRWLEIGVCTNGGGTFTNLTPRQQITATPYAITASLLTGTLSASQLSGTLPLAQLPGTVLTNGESGVTLTGTFTGNGAGVTNVALGTLNSSGAIIWGNFVNTSSPVVGSNPGSVTAADVNGDDTTDLISANSGFGSGNTLTVLTNNGRGGFVPASSLTVGSGPFSVTTADVNGDGKVDLISANSGANTLTVLTNNGSDGFVLASSPGVGSGPVSVTAADVNADGKVDLISANQSAFGTLSVLTNNGSGGFTLASSPSVGSTPFSVTTADVNGDGKVDLISANSGANTLSVLTNNGSGSFGLASSPVVVGNNPNSVAAADVNGDGKVDLIANSGGLSTLSVLTNNGSGGFVFASSPGAGNSPRSVTAADVNGDGKLDLITANNGADTLTVLTNNGSGRFVLASSPGVGNGPISIAAADVNGDGKLDLISANSSTNTLTVLLNTPTFQGNFTGNGAGLTGVVVASGSTNYLQNQTVTDQTAGFRINGDGIFNGGRVSIGTTAPEGALHVAEGSAGTVTANANSIAVLEKSGNGYLSLLTPSASESGVLFGSPTNSADGGIIYNGSSPRGLAFRTGGNSTRMMILADGKLGIGRTPATNILEIEGTASKTAAGSWLANSDARIKTDVHTVTRALEKLGQVRPVEFRYTAEYRAQHPGLEDRPYLNVIAQEFQKVFPAAVKRSGDKLPNGDEILQVDTYPLTIYSAAAIQELNRKFEDLSGELKRRDTENAELKLRLEKLEQLTNPRNGGVK